MFLQIDLVVLYSKLSLSITIIVQLICVQWNMFWSKHDVLSSATDRSDVFSARGGSALGWATCRRLTRCCQKQMRSHVPPEICHGPGIIIYVLSRTIYTISVSKRSLDCSRCWTQNKEPQLSPFLNSAFVL